MGAALDGRGWRTGGYESIIDRQDLEGRAHQGQSYRHSIDREPAATEPRASWMEGKWDGTGRGGIATGALGGGATAAGDGESRRKRRQEKTYQSQHKSKPAAASGQTGDEVPAESERMGRSGVSGPVWLGLDLSASTRRVCREPAREANSESSDRLARNGPKNEHTDGRR